MSSVEDLLGTGVGLVALLVLGVVVWRSGLPKLAKQLAMVGLGLRLVGIVGRQAIAADARVYFSWGERYAAYFGRLDFSPLWDPALWRGSEWGGTNLIGYVTGGIMALIGPSWFGTFVGFALLSLVGVAAYGLAFSRAFPRLDPSRFWGWLFLFPSLWFWPSSIGKEAIMMLGLGVATLGLVGDGKRARWLLLGAGLAVVFAVRPQVAAVFLLAIVLGHWLNFQSWSPARVIQGGAILVLGGVFVAYALQTSRVGGADLESIQEYTEFNLSQTSQGGSDVGAVSLTPAGVGMAAVNVLFRPFLWEAHNLSAAVSALEIALMWGILWLRRRQLAGLARIWRRDRVLRFAVSFVVIYTVALGLNLANLGIIARQRTLMLPLFFLIVEAGALAVPTVQRVAPRLRPGYTAGQQVGVPA